MGFDTQHHQVILKGVLDIDDAPELKKAFLRLWVAGVPEVIVDASQVEDVDFSILQLLHSAWLTLNRAKKKLVVINPSAALLRRSEKFGHFPPLG